MVVSHEDDPNDRNPRPVDTAIGAERNWVVIWHKHEASAALQIKRELAGSIARKRMRTPYSEFSDGYRNPEVDEPGLQLASTCGAESAFRDSPLLAQLAEPLIVEPYVHWRVEGYRSLSTRRR
jgi:hypothetical protein